VQATNHEMPEDLVSQTTTVSAPGRSSSRILAIVLGILGVLAIILGVLYVAGALNSVHFLVGSHHKGSHTVRAGVSFVVGVVLLVLAWAANRSRSR
jgi:cytoskeletal protein RodZ